MKKFVLATSLFASAFAITPTSANDSSASIGLGGLTLTQNDAISMDSEELFISETRIAIKYRFTNTTNRDVETLVSFPLPAIPSGIDGYLGDQGYPNWKEDLAFRTIVDGKPVELAFHEQVSIIGEANAKDIRPRLKKLGWPERAWDDYNFIDKLQDLDAKDKAAYVKEGLLHKDAESDYVRPNWQIQAHVTRKQIFPAGKTIIVEHSYKPVAGGSVAGMLEPRSRKEDYFKEYAANYCIDKNFLKGFDKRRNTGKRDSDGNDMGMFYVETWLSYVLKSGANWKGPIKDFRLIVDKGTANNLVSFCMDGVKKISPTRFEVRKTNFEPSKDLEVLIVKWGPFD